MLLTAYYDPESDFVVTTYKGKVTAEDLETEEEQTIALANENDSRRFLIDIIDYEGSLSNTPFPVSC